MIGLIVLDKPAGLTSASAVGRIKHMLPRGTRIGHAGTLDRFATGVLVVLVGRATRLSEPWMGQTKTYEASVKLGAQTVTLDPESAERIFPDAAEPEFSRIADFLATQIGTIAQMPPQYSALKIGGRRASDFARRGKSAPVSARPVRIDSIDVIDWRWPMLQLRIQCGRGTYIRAIARDLGEALGIGGYLTQLRRTRVGRLDVKDAVTLESLQNGRPETYLQSPEPEFLATVAKK